MVFISKGIEVFLFVMNHVLHAFIDWCTTVPYLLQHSLKDDHIANDRIFQNINLQDKEFVNRGLNKIWLEFAHHVLESLWQMKPI